MDCFDLLVQGTLKGLGAIVLEFGGKKDTTLVFQSAPKPEYFN